MDKGYRGHDYQGDAQVHITGQRGKGQAGGALRKRKKRRSAVEPKMGHLKSDHRMDRNDLKGHEGDRLNALLAGIGANFRKLLAAFWHAQEELLLQSLLWLNSKRRRRHPCWKYQPRTVAA